MLYDLAIAIYDILVHLAAPFSRKPRKMMKGHWVVYELLRQQLEKDVRYIWSVSYTHLDVYKRQTTECRLHS